MHWLDEVFSLLHSFDQLGTRQLPNGRQMLGHAPHVGPEAYLHILFPGLKRDGLKKLEAEAGRRLPDQLSELYSRCNGMILYSGSLSIYGLRTSYARTGDEAWQPFSIAIPNVDERINDADPDAVFFGSYDWDGSFLYTSTNSPVVYRCSRESARPLNKWQSVQEMLLSEVYRLSKLFDRNGKEIDEDVATIP